MPGTNQRIGAIEELRALIESALEASLPVSALPGNQALNDAMRFGVFPGGKRFRPLFTLLAAEAAGVPAAKALDAACAIEFLHCSSLIFDDLPCMDDAGLRRNRPALHRMFGEPTAMLAALALLNEAYRLFGRHRRLIEEAAECIGVNGMIGGQCVDLTSPGLDLQSRDRKTSGLMRLTFVGGACCGDSSDDAIELLANCGERLGRAYQMLDDLVDASGAAGKTASQDQRHGRPTHEREPACGGERVLEEVNACSCALTAAFGHAAVPLNAAIQGIFAHVARAGLVAA